MVIVKFECGCIVDFDDLHTGRCVKICKDCKEEEGKDFVIQVNR